MSSYKWVIYNGKHQTTVRIDESTIKCLDIAFVEIVDLSKLVNDALKHYSSCPLSKESENGYELRLKVVEERLTSLEREISGHA